MTTFRMNRCSLQLAFLLWAVTNVVRQASAVDYCAASFCGTTTQHIACNNSGNFLSTCPAGASMVNMTAKLRNILINAHNAKRNYVAGGKVAKLPAACRMATMQWDNELATLAALNVRQCEMKHDACHNTAKFKYSGQNLAIMGTTATAVDHASNMRAAVQMWYSEVKYTTAKQIKSYPNNYNGPDIGHFTVMMAAKNIRLGCAASMYKSGSFNYYLVACNYATTNMIGEPLYDGCAKPAARCKKGRNPKYKNLCSTAETYAVNSF